MIPVVSVTGANGFLGRAICLRVATYAREVRGITRFNCDLSERIENVVVRSIDSNTLWRDALVGCNVVIHLAAKVHFMQESSADSLAEIRRVNVEGTLNLARQAALGGVRRFVFVSSIGVNGAETYLQPFTENDEVAPQSAYALSKFEAELGLQALATETGMEVVIIRPPLVYGPGAPGNFGLLLRWLKSGLPLPLGAIYNQRSLIALDNLVDFILTCLTHPQAANQTFLVSDGQDLSTTELVRGLAQAAGIPARLIPVPAWALRVGTSLLGKNGLGQRLCGNLQVDISKARSLLGWVPPVSVEEGLRRAMAL